MVLHIYIWPYGNVEVFDWYRDYNVTGVIFEIYKDRIVNILLIRLNKQIN